MNKTKYRFSERIQNTFTEVRGLRGLWEMCEKQMNADPELRTVVLEGPDSWCGGSFDDLLKIVKNGGFADPVEEARKIASKIATAAASKNSVPCWRLNVSGAFPSVPAFVSGSPECMLTRDRRSVSDGRGPITIWVATGASLSVEPSEIVRRGAIVLGAYLSLSRVRNVRVNIYNTNDRGNSIIRLPEHFGISELSALIASPNVYRRLMLKCSAYSVSIYLNRRGRKSPWCVGWSNWAHNAIRTREILSEYGMKNDDILLTPGKIGSWDDMTDEKIVNEINQMVRMAK